MKFVFIVVFHEYIMSGAIVNVTVVVLAIQATNLR